MVNPMPEKKSVRLEFPNVTTPYVVDPLLRVVIESDAAPSARRVIVLEVRP